MKKEITRLIRKHNKEMGCPEYNKGLKFKKMLFDRASETAFYDEENNLITLTVFELTFTFKPASKYDDNVIIYQFNLYSDGQSQIYFDGTRYEK